MIYNLRIMCYADSVQGIIRDVTTTPPSVADPRDDNTVAAIFGSIVLDIVILIAIVAIAIPVIIFFVRKHRKKSKQESTRYDTSC